MKMPYYAETRNRETGTIIVTALATELALDPCGGDCKWYNVCDEHDEIVGHTTLALAKSFAACPSEWCQGCREQLAEVAAQRSECATLSS